MKIFLLLILWIPICAFAQEDLLDEINTDSIIDSDVTAAFKGLKIVNFESTKLVAKKELTFVISHRFGTIKNGFDTFFGLDDAVTRLNFIYGISDGFNIGISRSTYQKTYEGSLKYRLVSQRNNGFPFTIVGYNSLLVNTALNKENLPKLKFVNRLSYASQILISRKVNTNLSLEIMPTYLHDNYEAINEQDNDQYAIGVGGRYKLGKRWALNMDYGFLLNRASTSPFKNPLSIGVDLETGGHVFQMHFTNAQPMNTNGFLSEASGDWADGDIYFGFNISRVF